MPKEDLRQTKNQLQIFISWILIISFFALVIYSIKNIFLLFSFAFLLSYLLKYPVNLINKYINNKALSLGIFVLLCVILVGLFSVFLYPILHDQTRGFIEIVPALRESAINLLNGFGMNFISERDLESPENIQNFLFKNMKKLDSESLFGFFGNSLQNTISILTFAIIVLIATVFLVIDSEQIWNNFVSLFPKTYSKRIEKIGSRINASLEAMVIGQFKLAVITSTVMLITYIAIGSKFAILLGLLQMLEVVPFLGTWIGFICGFVVVLLTLGIQKSFIVAGVYLVYSQIIRDQFITSKIYGNAFGVHPLGMILGFLIGVKIFGILGIVGILPIIALLNSIYVYYSHEE